MADSLDCTNALQPCACTANQICVQIGRSSTECARNTCVDRAQNGGSGGGKSNIGALAGQAVGGVIGGILILGALYWFWRRKRAGGGGAARTGGASNKGRSGNGSAPNSATSRKSPNPLKEFKMGTGGGKGEKDVTASPGPGEGDAQPVKRQSLRFDRNNNPLSNRRSLSNTHNALPDNPFGDHHGSSDGASTRSGATDTTETGAGLHGQRRESHATISEFSFRSSHSTNIIPIAYIPAHASQNGTVDQQRRHTMSVRDSTSTAGGMRRSTNPLGVRGSRASVPFSLHSSTTTNDAGLSMGDATFSGLFDRRMSAHTAGGESANGNGLEIIANANGPASPSLTTPTLTKNGRPIRPPRAPGLDLKLPTPELKSPTALSPPISPGYPWSSSKSGSTSPGALAAAGGLAPPGSAGISPRSQRETLMTADGANARASAYSTFSQATGSTGSHMSYLLDPPMIVTPVSAGRVEIQQIQRGVAKTVKLGSPNPGTLQGSPSVPAVPAQYLATSPALSRSNTLTLRSGSPNSDNPFEDANAEVRIAMPSGNSPILPNTPTFGGNASPFSDSNLPGARGSFASQASHTTRRDSDLSIFTSASGQLGATTSQQQAQADPRAATPSTTSARMSHSHSASVSITAEDEVILEPPMRPFAASGDFAPSGPGSDSRHNSAALSTRSGYASVLDGIPFNLSLSPEARHSQASSAGGSGAAGGHGSGVFLSQPHGQLGAGQRRTSNLRDSSASYASGSTADELHNGSDKRDTSYSLASEWNGAFAGMPIVMGGPTDAAVPELPAMYRQTQTQAQMDGSAQRSGDDENDPRYSSDSLAMAAAVARQFGTH